MALTQIDLPSAAAIQEVMDGLAGWLRAAAALGTGAPSETTTSAYKARLAQTRVLGDGTSTYPGIDNARIQAVLQDPLLSLVRLSGYPTLAGLLLRQPISRFEQCIQEAMPPGWAYTGAGLHYLDAHLTRLNGNASTVPATPTDTPTLTAATGGAIAPTTSGAEPRAKIAFVGAYDYIESQPSAASSQVALAGKYNAWTLAGLTGNVPSGVTKLRVYRQLDNNAGASDPYYWDQDVAVVAGVAWSTYTITLSQPEQALRRGVRPVVWLQAMQLPEAAAAFALAYSIVSQTPGQQDSLPTFQTSGMLSPGNVSLGPMSRMLLGNPSSTAEMARRVIGTGFVAGAVPTASVPANALQGFSGAAGGVQARVTSVLDAGASITNVTYTYLDAAHPTTPQNGTIAGALSLSAAVGSVVDLAVPAGRLVKTVTGDTCGTATSGTYIYEAIDLRSV